MRRLFIIKYLMKYIYCLFLFFSSFNTLLYANIHQVEYNFFNHYKKVYPYYISTHTTNHEFVINNGIAFWQKFNKISTIKNIAYEENIIAGRKLEYEDLKTLYHLSPLRALSIAYYYSSELYSIYLKKYLEDRLTFFQKIQKLSINEKKQLIQCWCLGHSTITLIDHNNKKNSLLPLLLFNSACSLFAEEILRNATKENINYYLKKQAAMHELNTLLLLSKHNVIYTEYYFHALLFSCVGLTDEEMISQIMYAKYIIYNNFEFKDYILNSTSPPQ